MESMEELEIISKKDKKQHIWVEKYRPKKLEDYLGNDIIKETFTHYIKNQDIPNLLLYSGPGTGKSSSAKILAREIKSDSIYINASDERGIDLVRDKVKIFASASGFNPIKIIILDECLDENTLVTILRSGEVIQTEIKNLKEETDLVKSYNIDKNKIEWRPFLMMDKGVQDVYEMELENGEVIVCTDSHKWYVNDTKTNMPIKMKLKDILAKNIKEILSF